MSDDSKSPKYGTGALPPPGLEWQEGKTAASIAFVNEGQRYLKTCTDPDHRAKLQAMIDEVKSGRRALTDWLTVEDYLKNT